MHAPEVECVGEGKARHPYEFGVKVGIATTEKGNLIVDARAFLGNSCDGNAVAEQIKQVTILMQDVKGAAKPRIAIVDLGCRGVEVPVRDHPARPDQEPGRHGAPADKTPSGGDRAPADYGGIGSTDRKAMCCTRCRVPPGTTCAG